ncbi:SDR family NAD(P)-dependent oxidoreductase [Streptomyces carpinensis]|uniref:SDR family NAD(P)-dependent oxidoreductase n=1 Tax=Streptomyces carpinensis TaxID=66369 RepID=A0ABV1VUQ9_9ACTN|nr:SDR family NAD(P)-dependent oxidoreductase [Streptomyces carpinensis]
MQPITVDASSVVVITGGATGVGRSMALAFAERGAQVVLADIDQPAARATAEGMQRNGHRAEGIGVDVAQAASVHALADRVFGTYGKVDVLCNNAGVTMRPFRASWNASAQDFAWIMGVNYHGVVHGILSFVPRMRAQPGHKHMVNTASFTALDVMPGHAAYAASKAAVIALSDALRIELADHGEDFGVTVLYAGAIPTRLVTSERLRPESERSAARGVIAYQPSRPEPFHTAPRPLDEIGELVVGAVLEDKPAVLTHRYPHDEIEARLAQLRAGAPAQPSPFPTRTQEEL